MAVQSIHGGLRALVVGEFADSTRVALAAAINDLSRARSGKPADITVIPDLAVSAIADDLDLVVCRAEQRDDVGIDTLDAEQWDRSIEVNGLGAWRVARAVIPRLEVRRGSLVVVTTRAGEHPVAFGGTMSVGKAFEASFIANLALEVRPRGVSICSVRVSPRQDRDSDTRLAAVLGYVIDREPADIAGTIIPLDGPERLSESTTAAFSAPALPERGQLSTRERARSFRAIITGGGGEIGRASASALHASARSEGWDGLSVLLADRDADRLTAAAESLEKEGVVCAILNLDVSAPDAGERTVGAAVDAFGGLDFVFSNAARGVGTSAFEAEEELVRSIFALNVRATALLAAAAAPWLERSGGSLVATSSIASRLRNGRAPVYAASKAAVTMLVRQLALEWARRGMRANVVVPGSIDTPMNTLNMMPAEQAAAVIAAYPSPYNGRPENVGAVVAFLASEAASYVTGQPIAVDGGLVEWMG